MAARRLASIGGRVALVLPESVLGARDAGPARTAALEGAELVGLWVAGEPVFDAATKVCAPVLEVGSGRGEASGVRRSRGAGFEPLPAATPPRDGSWSRLALAAYGTPEVDLAPGTGTVGDLASATAGFRRQFYGLVPYVSDGPVDCGGAALLVTAGLIDPGACAWGRRPARFAGSTFERPVVDLQALAAGDPVLAAWVAARLVPKVVVASQTKVVEAAADPAGRWLPSTPVVSVEPFDPDDVGRVAAVLLAPTTSAWALAHAGGTALAADTIKLSAGQVAGVPLPAHRGAWDRGTSCLSSGGAIDWDRFGAAMLEAYGLRHDHPVLAWWRSRLPASGGPGHHLASG